MTSNNGTTTIEGAVQAVNEQGVKVNGAWYNRSQYGPDGPLPAKGERERQHLGGVEAATVVSTPWARARSVEPLAVG
jgi:hypothetical protein